MAPFERKRQTLPKSKLGKAVGYLLNQRNLSRVSWMIRERRSGPPDAYYNTERLHCSLNYRTPQEFAASCAPYDSASLRLQAHSSGASTSLATATPLQLN